MTDIVERLREWPSNHDDAIEAANEIERLRKENAFLRLGWCREAEKRMKEWQQTTVGTTGCEICNNAGHVEVTYLHQDGKFSTGWTKCTKCNT